MNISELFIRRPVMTTIMMGAISPSTWSRQVPLRFGRPRPRK